MKINYVNVYVTYPLSRFLIALSFAPLRPIDS